MNLSIIEQKLVNFNGAEIMSVKTNDGKVRVGVSWVCEGVGLTQDQAKNERRKIQGDIVLQKGGLNLTLPTKGGLQNVLTIELDFLPLWLAKISITPTMQKDSPDVTEKLVQYQLKAKDVLAKAFIEKPMSQLEIMQMAVSELTSHDKRITNLEENMRIDGAQERRLQTAGKSKVIESLGGMKSNAYRKIASRVFPQMWGDFKRHFVLPRYSELPKVQFNEGLEFINEWTPSTSLRLEIRELNNQQHLKLAE